MFDTVKVGKKIAQLRKANNMTQFDLADTLGISFQAVSNWERGNSMPDISKLPEIAELFHVSIDEILGKSNAILNQVAEGKEIEVTNLSEKDISEAAALMKPQQIKETVDPSKCDPKTISAFLPFLDDDYIEELLCKYKAAGNNIAVFLPFLSYEKIEELAGEAITKGESIKTYLPFMRDEKIKQMAFSAFDKGGIQEASQYFPFMNEKDLRTLAEMHLAKTSLPG